MVRHLGPGPGRCLDLGCGTGLAVPLLSDAGWSVVGVDASADQLAVARERVATLAELHQADAHALPFENDSFQAAVLILTHTDFDDPTAVFREVARVLVPGAVFVYGGVHPVFGSPLARPLDDGATLFEPGYRQTGWQTVSRDPHNPGIRARVGINHATLAGLFTSLFDAGFTLTAIEEPGERDPPLFLVLRLELR